MMRQRILFYSLIGLLMIGVAPIRAQTSGWEVIYLYRDESVEASQGYQLSSMKTNDASNQPHTLRRFPIDGISVPWDVPPPTALSPDGSTLAMIQWDEKQGGALLVKIATGETTPLPVIQIKGLFDTTLLGWTPDGTRLILYNSGQDGGQLIAYSLAQATLTTLFTLNDATTIEPQVTLSPDAARVLYCTAKGNGGCAAYAIRTLADNTKTLIALPNGTSCVGYPALKWSPNGKKIALDCQNVGKASLTLIDSSTGLATAYPVSSEVNDVAWSPDSARILIDLCAGNYVNADDADCGALQFMDVTSGALTAGPAIERTEARRLYWLGNSLVFDESSGGGQEATLYFYDMTSKQTKQFSRNASTYQDASFIVMGARPVQ